MVLPIRISFAETVLQIYVAIMGKISKRLRWVIFIVYLLVLIKVILLKTLKRVGDSPVFYKALQLNQHYEPANFVPFRTINLLFRQEASWFVIENIVGNIVLFIPLGILLPILIPAFSFLSRVILTAFAVSLAFELIQLIAGLGIFDVDDLILNTIGGGIGFAVYKKTYQVYTG